jgi:hypothetical protein
MAMEVYFRFRFDRQTKAKVAQKFQHCSSLEIVWRNEKLEVLCALFSRENETCGHQSTDFTK